MFNYNILPTAKLLFILFMFDYIILSTLNILLEVSKLEYFLNSKEHILRGSFLATLVVIKKGGNYETKVWLISVLMITKQGLELMIIFQV